MRDGSGSSARAHAQNPLRGFLPQPVELRQCAQIAKHRCSGRQLVCRRSDEIGISLHKRSKKNGATPINENSQGFSSSESSSEVKSCRCSVPLGGMSVCQSTAASLTVATTFRIRGLRVLSPSQHFWITFHKESEIPIASAFAGFSGRTPKNDVVRKFHLFDIAKWLLSYQDLTECQ